VAAPCVQHLPLSRRAGEHARGSVDPHKVYAGARKWYGQPTGAAPQLENGPSSVAGNPPPERKVLPPKRSLVFPIVIGGVGVPGVGLSMVGVGSRY
jgi:hypothetical protein